MNNRISELRKKCHISQRELAVRLGVSTSAIGMYEQGRREPDTKTLLRLAQEFNVTVDYLICATDVNESFDIDVVSRNIAESLLANPALLITSEIYSEQDLSTISSVIEDSVKISLLNQITKGNP